MVRLLNEIEETKLIFNFFISHFSVSSAIAYQIEEFHSRKCISFGTILPYSENNIVFEKDQTLVKRSAVISTRAYEIESDERLLV